MSRAQNDTTDSQAARETKFLFGPQGRHGWSFFIKVMLGRCQVSIVLIPFNETTWTLAHFPGCVGRATASRMRVKRLKPATACSKNFRQLKHPNVIVAELLCSGVFHILCKDAVLVQREKSVEYTHHVLV